MMKDVRRQVFENALRYSFGLMHTKPPTRLAGERGSQPLWRSPDQLISALWRAVEAIEFEGWKPGDRSVILNRRWNIKNVRTATIKFIVAYWLEIEGLEVGTVDSGRMRKWLNSLGLPCFSMLRSEIRQRITIRRLRQTLFKAYGGNLLAHMLVDRLNFPSD
jgi:hypothetical protein